MCYNPWSLRNKVAGVLDLMEDYNCDIGCIQETFLRKSDGVIFSEIKERGYKIHSFRKSHYESHGGGVAILYKQLLQVSKVTSKKKYSSFEHVECLVKTQKDNIRIVNLYRTPSTTKYYQPMSVFKEEFADYLEDLSKMPGRLYFVGDFNVDAKNWKKSENEKTKTIVCYNLSNKNRQDFNKV